MEQFQIDGPPTFIHWIMLAKVLKAVKTLPVKEHIFSQILLDTIPPWITEFGVHFCTCFLWLHDKFPQIQQLKTSQISYLTVSVGQKSRMD